MNLIARARWQASFTGTNGVVAGNHAFPFRALGGRCDRPGPGLCAGV